MQKTAIIVLAIGAFACGANANAQVVNPANAQPATQSPRGGDERLRTWEMAPVDVYGSAPLRDDDRIGAYAQPRWTADRLFSETRVYVIPKGKVEFEYWLKPKTPKNGPSEFTQMYEVEFGLPGRLQLDLYANANKTGAQGAMSFNETQVELRYAFADWGKIWGNPTAYVEWKQESEGPDVAELKLLLGGQMASGWHWGSNLVWEHQTGGAEETSNEWTVGISHTVKDQQVSVGIETQLAFVNEKDRPGHRTPFATEFLVGPSFQFRPLPQVHLDIAPLFGVTAAAPRAKVFVVFGYEF